MLIRGFPGIVPRSGCFMASETAGFSENSPYSESGGPDHPALLMKGYDEPWA